MAIIVLVIEMGVKKYDWVSCEHEKGKDTWKCELDSMKKEFESINLKGDEDIEFFPSEGDVAFQTIDTYCSMIEGEKTPHLFCDTSKERLGRRLSEVKRYGIIH